jgi:hypothetical protein
MTLDTRFQAGMTTPAHLYITMSAARGNEEQLIQAPTGFA